MYISNTHNGTLKYTLLIFSYLVVLLMGVDVVSVSTKCPPHQAFLLSNSLTPFNFFINLLLLLLLNTLQKV